MYQCKYCGNSAQEPGFFWCGNPRCRSYGRFAAETLNCSGDAAPPTPYSQLSQPSQSPQLSQNDCRMPEPPCNGELPLGFATVPFQKMKQLYNSGEALTAGTVFPELNMPWKSRLNKKVTDKQKELLWKNTN